MFEEITHKLIDVFSKSLDDLVSFFEKELGLSAYDALVIIVYVFIKAADDAEVLKDVMYCYSELDSDPKLILKEDIIEFKTKYMLSLKEELDSVKNDNEILRAVVADLCKKKEGKKEN